MKATPKRIILLAADVSDNCMGRVWILADMLSRYAEVEILGIASHGSIWPPLAGNQAHRVKGLQGGIGNPFMAAYRLCMELRRHKKDLLFVCKPKLHTLLAALLAGGEATIALDIDDWEARATRTHHSGNAIINKLAALGISFTQLADKLIPLIQLRTVSNSFLQARYSGALIPHARENIILQEEGREARARFHLPQDVPVVLFLGTPHRHKGVMQLIEAVALARHRQLHLVIAGLPDSKAEYEQYHKAALQKLQGRVTLLPYVDWKEKEALARCVDIIAVPQSRNIFTEGGQTPAKICDAMAAAKPLVVSDLSDIRDITQGHAWLVPPDDAQALADALDHICDDPDEARRRAGLAYQCFLERFSYDAVAPRLAKQLRL